MRQHQLAHAGSRATAPRATVRHRRPMPIRSSSSSKKHTCHQVSAPCANSASAGQPRIPREHHLRSGVSSGRIATPPRLRVIRGPTRNDHASPSTTSPTIIMRGTSGVAVPLPTPAREDRLPHRMLGADAVSGCTHRRRRQRAHNPCRPLGRAPKAVSGTGGSHASAQSTQVSHVIVVMWVRRRYPPPGTVPPERALESIPARSQTTARALHLPHPEC